MPDFFSADSTDEDLDAFRESLRTAWVYYDGYNGEDAEAAARFEEWLTEHTRRHAAAAVRRERLLSARFDEELGDLIAEKRDSSDRSSRDISSWDLAGQLIDWIDEHHPEVWQDPTLLADRGEEYTAGFLAELTAAIDFARDTEERAAGETPSYTLATLVTEQVFDRLATAL